MKWVAVALLVTTAACTKIPSGRTAVDSVAIVGNRHLADADIESKIATSSTPKFLGLFRGVIYDYSVYDRYVLAYDLARVERLYRARGYYEAHARAGRVMQTRDHHVQVEIVVDEGVPTTVTDVRWHVDSALPETEDRAMRRAMIRALPKGALLDEDKLEEAKAGIRTTLENHSYAKVQVATHVEVDLASHGAVVDVTVHPAEKCVTGPIRIEGFGRLPEKALRRELGLDPGEPYSRQKLEDAQQRLLSRGVVSSVVIEPQLEGSPYGVVPIVVRVQPARLRQLHLGGGFELDTLKADVHARIGWRDLNFLGDLRRFSVELTPGVVLYPTRLSYLNPPTNLFPEQRLRAELRQLGFIEHRIEGFIRPEVNTYPVIIRETFVPGEPVIGYFEIRSSEGVERLFWDNRIHASFSHTVQIDWPFAYAGSLVPSAVTLAVSYIELEASLDLRNNRIEPTHGLFVLSNFQVAGLGGQPQDIRVAPEVRGYYPLGSRVVIAARAALGFLFPFNYAVSTNTRDVEIVYFRGFFSGGPNQNRGYPQRGIGPQGNAPLYAPLGNTCLTPQQVPQCLVPLGGLSLWELSLESRIRITGPFHGVAFCDTADVTADAFTLHLDRPHLSCGLGARYETPVGPVRLDVAYRIPGLQVLSGTQEFVTELLPGVPLMISIALGEAF